VEEVAEALGEGLLPWLLLQLQPNRHHHLLIHATKLLLKR
jgi:hypothetical protein